MLEGRALAKASAACVAHVVIAWVWSRCSRVVVVAPLAHGCDGALVLERNVVRPLRSPKVTEMGLQGRDTSLPPCVAAMCPLSMMRDARLDMARRSMAMLPSHLNGPSVGC